MENAIGTSYLDTQMSDKVFEKLGTFIEDGYGIKMPPSKKTMLQGRLSKRLRLMGMNSFESYCDFILNNTNKSEIVNMINAVSTNKTDFFREPEHFSYLINTALPDLVDNRPAQIRTPFVFWSAGCSTGEEPYTLAMVLSDYAETNPDFSFRILATDISTDALNKGKAAIYKKERVDPVPKQLKKKYLLKSKNPKKNLVRIALNLRQLISFQRLNFLDNFDLRKTVDVIFCRNVIIYFDKEVQRKLLNKFYQHLRTGGYLLIGHSETMNGIDLPFVNVAPTIYKKV